LAHGRDPREVEPDLGAKSISVEETYDRDLEGMEVVETALLAHAQRLSGRLRRSGLKARTITLKARYADFTTLTRSHTFSASVDGSRQLFRVAVDLVRSLGADVGPVRLLGLGGSGLEPANAPVQLDIDGEPEWDKVEDAVAGVRERFGDDAVGPARLIGDRRPAKSDQEP
jgi:DNA polymerase-4